MRFKLEHVALRNLSRTRWSLIINVCLHKLTRLPVTSIQTLTVSGLHSVSLSLQMQDEVDALADRVELANNALLGDWSRWQSSMRTDLRSAFVSAAEKNVEYYEKVSSRCNASTTAGLHRRLNLIND